MNCGRCDDDDDDDVGGGGGGRVMLVVVVEVVMGRVKRANGNGAANGGAGRCGSESSACECHGGDGHSWSFWLFPAHRQSAK